MPLFRRYLLLVLAATVSAASASLAEADRLAPPLVIAHRGASGYLPEHTLEAKATAHAMGADYVEQDVVLSRDGVPVVLHDVHIDTVTDVARRYPDRSRADGRFYALDFTLAELKTLRVHERVDHRTGQRVYPHRFPLGKASFRIPTLAEELELIAGLNATTGRHVGIYPEIKHAAWHRRQGYDISAVVLEILADLGYQSREDRCFLQCFEAEELKRIRHELGCRLKLAQLLGQKDLATTPEFNRRRVAEQLRVIAGYADAVGPELTLLVDVDASGEAVPNNVVPLAHELGLAVHPYTLRRDALPSFVETLPQLHTLLLEQVGVDGFFTDFPDLGRRAADGIKR